MSNPRGQPVKEWTACKVGACTEKARIRRMCNTHYRRWKKYGDPTKVFGAAKNEAEKVTS